MMLRYLTILLCFCGCAAPVHNITVRVPPADVARCPDLSGVLLLRASGVALHPKLKVALPWGVNGSAVVVARRGDYWYAATCQHCLGYAGATITVDGEPAEPYVENAAMDLALVRFKSDRYYRQYPIGEPVLAQTVYVAGWTASPRDNPTELLAGEPLRHVRRGIVSWVQENCIGFDSGARDGFSGGAVLTPAGRLIGVSQRMNSQDPGFASAVHSRHVETLLYSLPPP